MKEYKSIDEQIDYLVKEKNIDKKTIVRSVFLEKSYLSIINPYTDLVCIGRKNAVNISDRKHIYRENTDFNLYLNWCKVDEYISSTLHESIGVFENKLKTFLSNTICKMMKNEGDLSCSNYTGFRNYLSAVDFLDFLPLFSYEDLSGNILTMIGTGLEARQRTIQKIISIVDGDNRGNLLIYHYRKKGYIPFWILIRGLTINELVQLFLMLKYEYKKNFLETYINKEKINNKDVFKFCSKLTEIAKIRNIVNHYEPLIPFILSYQNERKQILFETIELLCDVYLMCNLKNRIELIEPEILTPINEYNKNKIARIIRILEILRKTKKAGE